MVQTQHHSLVAQDEARVMALDLSRPAARFQVVALAVGYSYDPLAISSIS